MTDIPFFRRLRAAKLGETFLHRTDAGIGPYGRACAGRARTARPYEAAGLRSVGRVLPDVPVPRSKRGRLPPPRHSATVMSSLGTLDQSKAFASSAGVTGSGRSIWPAQKARRPVSSAGVNR